MVLEFNPDNLAQVLMDVAEGKVAEAFASKDSTEERDLYFYHLALARREGLVLEGLGGEINSIPHHIKRDVLSVSGWQFFMGHKLYREVYRPLHPLHKEEA